MKRNKTRLVMGRLILNWFLFFPSKFLMTPGSLAGCLEPGTPPSHTALRSSHQLASGTGIGVYGGPYPKSQGYYNPTDATALYSRVSFTFHIGLFLYFLFTVILPVDPFWQRRGGRNVKKRNHDPWEWERNENILEWCNVNIIHILGENGKSFFSD